MPRAVFDNVLACLTVEEGALLGLVSSKGKFILRPHGLGFPGTLPEKLLSSDRLKFGQLRVLKVRLGRLELQLIRLAPRLETLDLLLSCRDCHDMSCLSRTALVEVWVMK